MLPTAQRGGIGWSKTTLRRPGVWLWLIYYKKNSGKSRVAYAEAVEEALCFGWIDSRPNVIDEESYKQLFSPPPA